MAIAAQAEEFIDAATFLDRLGPDAERQELIGGRVVMMTGGTARAFALTARLVALLDDRLPRGCTAFGGCQSARTIGWSA